MFDFIAVFQGILPFIITPETIAGESINYEALKAHSVDLNNPLSIEA